jgi:hypothetical protein
MFLFRTLQVQTLIPLWRVSGHAKSGHLIHSILFFFGSSGGGGGGGAMVVVVVVVGSHHHTHCSVPWLLRLKDVVFHCQNTTLCPLLTTHLHPLSLHHSPLSLIHFIPITSEQCLLVELCGRGRRRSSGSGTSSGSGSSGSGSSGGGGVVCGDPFVTHRAVGLVVVVHVAHTVEHLAATLLARVFLCSASTREAGTVPQPLNRLHFLFGVHSLAAACANRGSTDYSRHLQGEGIVSQVDV